MRADALTPAIAPRMAELAQRRHPLRRPLQRRKLVARRHVLPLLRSPGDLLGCLRQPHAAAGADGPVPDDTAISSDCSPAPPCTARAALDRTALARVPNLRLQTKSPYPGSSGADRTVTEEWLEWLDRRDPARPFFGFLYYDAAVRCRAARQLSVLIVAVPPGASTQVRPVRPLPHRRALCRLPARTGPRRPAAPEAPREHRGHRHLRPRHGVQRKRAGLHEPRHGLQRASDAYAPGRPLARATAGAHRPPHLP